MCPECDDGQKMPADPNRQQYPGGSVIYWCRKCTAAISRHLYPKGESPDGPPNEN